MKFARKLATRIAPFAVIAVAALLLLYLPDFGPERYTDLATFFKAERARQGYSGYAIAVVADGAVLYVDAFGTDGRGSPLSPIQPMPLASLSATFTGLLARQIEADARLDIDRPVATYLPGFNLQDVPESRKPPTPPESSADALKAEKPAVQSLDPASSTYGREPTTRLLLAHRSGVTDRDIDDKHLEARDLDEAVAILSGAVPQAKLGAEFHYLDSGYQTVGRVLERASGKSYAELVTERVFKPLGMSRSLSPEASFAENLPSGSGTFFGASIPRSQALRPALAPSGHLVSTAVDMAKYLAWYASPRTSKIKLLPAKALPKLFAPLYPSTSYGYGWTISGADEDLKLEQSGSLEGFSATATIWPNRRAAIAIFVPQSGLLQSMFALPALTEGAKRIMFDGESWRLFPFGRLFVLLAVIAAVHLIVLAAQTGDALRWSRLVRGRAEAAGERGPLAIALLRCICGILFRILLLFITPFVLSSFLGRELSWSLTFGIAPDVAGWYCAALAFGSLRNVTRLAWLRGPGRPRLGLRKRR